MEMVIFCGIQASGKSSFYIENFFNSHLRISLDLLRTRHREKLFLDACIKSRQKCVVDNTNPSQADRAKYIELAKAHQFKILGYYFSSSVPEALARNATRPEPQRVPDVAIKGTLAKLERPSSAEGFDELYYVAIEEGGFKVSEWKDEI